MRSTLWFVSGFTVAVVLLAIIVMVGLNTTVHGFSTNATPTALETWTARQARALALPKNTKHRINPVPDTPEMLKEARAHWADHCASCHANNGSGESDMGQHLYPPSPDMRQPGTQQMTDGELFYVIQNGIRLSGMPSWGADHSGEEDSWKLVRFIRHLPKLSSD